MARRTDWDAYYGRPYATATFSRWVTGVKLVGLLRRFAPRAGVRQVVVELGGANSCFFDLMRRAFRPARYVVVDNNRLGLALLRRRIRGGILDVRHADVLTARATPIGDVVYSVGLIEHFDRRRTARCIAAHFRYVKPGGICLITYPTPTWLYRATRRCSERLGLWIFHDERPLGHREVGREAARHGTILHRSTTWATFLTQGVLVVRARGGA